MVIKGLALILSHNINNLLTYDISVSQSMNVPKRLSGGVLKKSFTLRKNI